MPMSDVAKLRAVYDVLRGVLSTLDHIMREPQLEAAGVIAPMPPTTWSATPGTRGPAYGDELTGGTEWRHDHTRPGGYFAAPADPTLYGGYVPATREQMEAALRMSAGTDDPDAYTAALARVRGLA